MTRQVKRAGLDVGGVDTGVAMSEVSAALSVLQRALRELVRALPAYPTRAPELQQMLGIDRSLAWKVHRLMHARTAAEAAGFVPGASAVVFLFHAAKKVG